MSQNIEREGIFLARPIEWGIVPAKKTEAVALFTRYQILGQYDGDDLVSWDGTDVTADGYHYWVGRNGTLDQPGVERLIRSGLWDGKLSSVHGNLPPDVEVRITVECDQYGGKDRYRVAWVNHKNDTAGSGAQQIDDSDLKQLEARFGSLLRATAAEVKKTAAPQAAPQATASSTPPAQATNPTTETADDGLPF